MTRTFLRLSVVAGVVLINACAASGPAPPVKADPKAPVVFEQKMRWILLLEDQRQVRVGGGDLIALLADPEARIRRRAALALGRVKLPEALPALTSILQSEPDVEVKQMAAFAMGLIGDTTAATALIAAVSDPDPVIQGRAAEALGMLAHQAAVPSVTTMVSSHINAGALKGITPDDMAHPKTASAEAVRLGLYALVRLGSYDGIAGSVLDENGRPRSRWWPIAYALQRVNDARAVPALLDLLNGEGQITRAFAARGLGQLKDPRRARRWLPLPRTRRTDRDPHPGGARRGPDGRPQPPRRCGG